MKRRKQAWSRPRFFDNTGDLFPGGPSIKLESDLALERLRREQDEEARKFGDVRLTSSSPNRLDVREAEALVENARVALA